MSTNAKATLAVIAATAVSIVSFASLALPSHAQGEEDNQHVFVRHDHGKVADAFEVISNGMPAADVLAAIGPPSAKVRFAATKTTAWDYRYRDPWGEDSGFAVILDDNGVVVGKTRVRESG